MSTEEKFYKGPEIWGGIECTINRVGDCFRDQLEDSGHYTRPADLDHFEALGIKAIRYPVLWEKHQPIEGELPDFKWISGQLTTLRQKNIQVIAGLVHHGSGPAFTSLEDEKFPEKLSAYAALVARQFPWIDYYTPVNEPLTTARFSGLYGTWYPHKKDAAAFMRMLLNEVKATILAILAIRQINPAAKLVQTEDIARIKSSTKLRYQARFENHRRWLSFDLLCGRVTPKHPLWKYILSLGIRSDELRFFMQHPCPPDIIGSNYYVTSERYLDEAYENYPSHCKGGNGIHCYADVESVRVKKMAGLKALLKEVWNRYHIPIAITEVHLHCTREEQLRWLAEAWVVCKELAAEKIPVMAMTVWAMLGSFDWNSLLTRNDKVYESGVFDIRNNSIRQTALARFIKGIALNQPYQHPVLLQKGWWHNISPKKNVMTTPSPPLLIAGKNGTLGRAFEKICRSRSLNAVFLSRQEMDICDTASVNAALDRYKPWALINTAGFVKVDEAEHCADECLRLNTTGPALLAAVCKEKGIPYMTFSSDMVFDGEKGSPYIEHDTVNPVNVYGRSKALAEEQVMKINPASLIIRTSSFFGPWDRYNFAWQVLDALEQGKPFTALKDIYISPTYVPDLAHAALDIFIDECNGIWHLTNNGTLSWAELALELADRCGLQSALIQPNSIAEVNLPAKRPAYTALSSHKGIALPTLEDALNRYIKEKVV